MPFGVSDNWRPSGRRIYSFRRKNGVAQPVRRNRDIRHVIRDVRVPASMLRQYGVRRAIPRIGTKKDVYSGRAQQTSGGLTASDLVLNKHGKVVSRIMSAMAKQNSHLGDCLLSHQFKKDCPNAKHINSRGILLHHKRPNRRVFVRGL